MTDRTECRVKRSAFAAWFEAQHGKRPGEKATDAELLERIRDGNRARYTIGEREKYDARLESALYAWQAREKMK